MPLGLGVLYRLLKLQPRKKLEQLTEYAAKSCCLFHKGAVLPFDVSFGRLPSSGSLSPFLVWVSFPISFKKLIWTGVQRERVAEGRVRGTAREYFTLWHSVQCSLKRKTSQS